MGERLSICRGRSGVRANRIGAIHIRAAAPPGCRRRPGSITLSESRVYGIDLGTTYSCIAHVDEASGRPTITPNLEGELTTPSVVLFEDAETRVVGREAKNTAMLESDNVIEMVKREMGESEWRREFFGRKYSPEEISSYILRKV